MKSAVTLFVLLVAFAAPARADGDTDRTRFLRDIVVERGQTLEDAVCIGCSVIVRGMVKGDAVVIWGALDVTGAVEGDAISVLGGIDLGPGAKITGDAISIGVRIRRDPDATIAGDQMAQYALPNRAALFAAMTGINLVLALLACLAAGPRRVANIAATFSQRFAATLLAGLGVAAVAVGLYFLGEHFERAETVLSSAVTIALCIFLLPGYAGLSFWLGHKLLRGGRRWLIVALGALVISVLQLLPTVGLLLYLVFIILALGCATLSRFGGVAPTAA